MGCVSQCGMDGLCQCMGAMFDSVLGVNGLCESVWNGWTVSVYWGYV